jgi:anaerobic magnesium-protoporphyrin IX monomethyl ester cyclase
MTKFHTFNDIKKYILEYSPDAVGTAGYTTSLYDAISVLRIVKEINPKIITMLGGIHSNFCWDEILQKRWQYHRFHSSWRR